MKKRAFTTVFVLVTAAVLIGIGAIAASNYGTSEDPLVTLSYINEVLAPNLLSQISGEIEDTAAELHSAIDSLGVGGKSAPARSFTPLELKPGDSLRLEAGTEIVLRSGSAALSGDALNMTAGQNHGGGELTANHLYMAAGEDTELICAAPDSDAPDATEPVATVSDEPVLVLIRGSYTLS